MPKTDCPNCGAPLKKSWGYRHSRGTIKTGYVLIAAGIVLFAVAVIWGRSEAGFLGFHPIGIASLLVGFPILIVGVTGVLRRRVWRCAACGRAFDLELDEDDASPPE